MTTETGMRRRRLLALGATGVVGALAGCSNPSKQQSTQSTDKGRQSRLGYIRVANWHAQPHTLHVLVERDDDPVHWSSHEMGAGNETVQTELLEHSWATDSGRFVVYVRIDNRGSWKRFDLTEQQGECYGVEARVNRDGDLGLWYEKSPPECRTQGSRPEQSPAGQ